MPQVSIIIPTFNRAKYLERTIRSCLDQDFVDLEVIVIDGGSNDGTVELLERLQRTDSRLCFVSRPDGGEVYAVNDGLLMASGNIYGVQASDDYYLPGAVRHAVDFLAREICYDGVAGDALFIDENGKELKRGMITYRRPMSQKSIKAILRNRVGGFLPHGSFFGRKAIFERIGFFNPNFSVTSDYEFYLRLLDSGGRIGCIPKPMLHYTIHSEMGAVKHRKAVEVQNKLLQIRHGFRWYDLLYFSTFGRIVSYISNPYRTPVHKRLFLTK